MWHVFKRLPHNVRSRVLYLLPLQYFDRFLMWIMNLRLVGMLQITPINLPLLFILVVRGLKSPTNFFKGKKKSKDFPLKALRGKRALKGGGGGCDIGPSAMIWISRLDGIVKQFTLSGPSKGPTGGCYSTLNRSELIRSLYVIIIGWLLFAYFTRTPCIFFKIFLGSKYLINTPTYRSKIFGATSHSISNNSLTCTIYTKNIRWSWLANKWNYHVTLTGHR